jgi:hypothetical protein
VADGLPVRDGARLRRVHVDAQGTQGPPRRANPRASGRPTYPCRSRRRARSDGQAAQDLPGGEDSSVSFIEPSASIVRRMKRVAAMAGNDASS